MGTSLGFFTPILTQVCFSKPSPDPFNTQMTFDERRRIYIWYIFPFSRHCQIDAFRRVSATRTILVVSHRHTEAQSTESISLCVSFHTPSIPNQSVPTLDIYRVEMNAHTNTTFNHSTHTSVCVNDCTLVLCFRREVERDRDTWFLGHVLIIPHPHISHTRWS
jgi:hypothetical protein